MPYNNPRQRSNGHGQNYSFCSPSLQSHANSSPQGSYQGRPRPVMTAVGRREIQTYIQMFEFCSKRREGHEKLIPEISLPKDVVFTLDIHGDEYSHLVLRSDHFGTEILKQMPLIFAETGCKIILADRVIKGCSKDFNMITFNGMPNIIEKASKKFLSLLPLHIGMHLTDLKKELKSVDLGEQLIKWMDEGVCNFHGTSFHFVKNASKNEYEYVVLRQSRNNPEGLIEAAIEFSKLVLNEAITTGFSAGYRLPSGDRTWFIDVSGTSPIQAISDKSNAVITLSNSREFMSLSVFGSPESLIRADELLTKLAQVTLQFEADDEDLKTPYKCNPSIENHLIEDKLVLVTYRVSNYQSKLGNYRHSIVLRTSYENRGMLYRVRSDLLKPHMTIKEGIWTVVKPKSNLVFGDQLQHILKSLEQSSHRNNNKS